jgi:hypothetical protein
MGDVDLETFMLGDGRSKCVDDVGEGWKSALA